MNPDKISSRRKKIFLALDTMKRNNEKISAQQLAKIVEMGKQTVLPIYREWIETEALTESENIALSDELVFSIKRELAKETFKLSEQTLNLQDEVDEQQHLIHQMQLEQANSQSEYESEKNQQSQAYQALAEQHKDKQHELEQVLKSLSETSKQNEMQTLEIAHLKVQMEQLKLSHEQALNDQSKHLDEAHQKIIDHWMKGLDNEKLEHQKSKEKIRSYEKIEQDLQKQILGLEYKQNHQAETIEQLKLSDETAKKEHTDLQNKCIQLQSLHQLLNHPDDIIRYTQQLLKQIEQYDRLKLKYEACNHQLNQLQKKNHAQDDSEKEIIKLRAYIEGLKQANTLKSE